MLQPLWADILLSYCGKSVCKTNLPLRNKETSVSVNKTDEQCGKSLMNAGKMGELWWCNLCTIIQIPQSCSVDLNALTAVNLLGLAVPARCRRVYCLHAEDQTVNEMTFIDHLAETTSHVQLPPARLRHRHGPWRGFKHPAREFCCHSDVSETSDISFAY